MCYREDLGQFRVSDHAEGGTDQLISTKFPWTNVTQLWPITGELCNQCMST